MTILTIGQLAKHAQVGVETIRFYEREGLIMEPQRSAAGYRLYAPTAIKRIRFIQRAKDVGFTLKDIRELLMLRQQDGISCQDIQIKAAAKIADIEQKLIELQRMKNALQQMANKCTDEQSASECPILDALEDDSEKQS